MDIVKNYALKMLREPKENSPSKRKALKSESRIKRARKFRSEAAQDWYFNPSDEGLSGVPSYSPDRLVHLRDDLTPDDWNDIKNIEGMNAMIPNSVLEYGTDDSNLEGTFSLTYSEGEYGFESYYGEDLDLMFYGYTKTIDELKDLVAKFIPYVADVTLEEIPFEDFAKRVSGVNSDDSEVAESADSESWRTEWKKGTGNDFAYDHNAPLLFKQTPDGEVSLTLGKNPYDGEEGYVGEMDYPEDFIVETGATVEEVLDKLSNYGAVDNYFDLNMPSQDLLNYIESSNEEDFSMDDVSITVQENTNEANKKEYGLQYSYFKGKDGKITRAEKFFATAKARDAFIEKLKDSGNLYEIIARSNPEKNEALDDYDDDVEYWVVMNKQGKVVDDPYDSKEELQQDVGARMDRYTGNSGDVYVTTLDGYEIKEMIRNGDLHESVDEALDYTEELDDLVDGNCLKLCDYLSDFLSPESVKHFYEYVRERIAEEKADLDAANLEI